MYVLSFFIFIRSFDCPFWALGYSNPILISPVVYLIFHSVLICDL